MRERTGSSGKSFSCGERLARRKVTSSFSWIVSCLSKMHRTTVATLSHPKVKPTSWGWQSQEKHLSEEPVQILWNPHEKSWKKYLTYYFLQKKRNYENLEGHKLAIFSLVKYWESSWTLWSPEHTPYSRFLCLGAFWH